MHLRSASLSVSLSLRYVSLSVSLSLAVSLCCVRVWVCLSIERNRAVSPLRSRATTQVLAGTVACCFGIKLVASRVLRVVSALQPLLFSDVVECTNV